MTSSTNSVNAFYSINAFVFDTLTSSSEESFDDDTSTLYIFGCPEISYIAGLVRLNDLCSNSLPSLPVGCDTLMGIVVLEDDIKCKLVESSLEIAIVVSDHDTPIGYKLREDSIIQISLKIATAFPKPQYIRLSTTRSSLRHIEDRDSIWLQVASHENIVRINDNDNKEIFKVSELLSGKSTPNKKK